MLIQTNRVKRKAVASKPAQLDVQTALLAAKQQAKSKSSNAPRI